MKQQKHPYPNEILDFDPDESTDESEIIRFCMDSGCIYSEFSDQPRGRRKPHLWEEPDDD